MIQKYAYNRKCKLCGKDFSTNKKSKIFCEFECQRTYNNYCGLSERNYYKTRWEILIRDNFTCQYCGRTAKHGVALQIDHICPKIRGGTDEKNNLITACWDCNIGKRDYYSEDFGKHFKVKKEKS